MKVKLYYRDWRGYTYSMLRSISRWEDERVRMPADGRTFLYAVAVV